MSRSKTLKGISLVETLVVSVLVFLIFYYIYKLLSPGLRIWRQSDIKVSLQQNTLVAMYGLKNELNETNRHTLTIKSYNEKIFHLSTLICFASARDKNGIFCTKTKYYGFGKYYDSKEPQWQKFVIYYLDDKKRLRRFEIFPYSIYKDNDARSMAIRGDPIGYVDVNNLKTNKVIARNIESLVIDYNPSEEDWRGGLDIKITACYMDPDPAETFRHTLATTVEVRYDEPDN